MANSFVRYTGDNSTTSYSIPFSYRSTADLTVTLAGVATTAYTLNAAGTTLTFNSAPASSVAIEIRRKTSQTTRLTDYADGSVLTENDLDTDSTQAFYMGQEAIDDANDVIKPSNTNFQWDANSKRIINVTNPVDNQDVATKHYLENTWLSASDKANINTVAGITGLSTVASNSTNINTVGTNITNVNTVATNISSVNTVAADITKVIAVANDLAEAVSEVETVADDLNEATSEIDTVASSITNVDAVGTNIANVNSVAGNETNINAVNSNSANINTVAGANANITTVAGANANITTLAGINADITTVAGISSNVTSVAGNETNINAVNTNSSNINTVAGSIANVNTVGGDIANVNTVAGNISGVNSFGDRYRVSSSAPASSLDVGDLYFDTTANELKVYKSSGWAAAGSTVNGTAQRYNYTATAAQTTFTGADTNGNTLAYDAGYADVYLNGVRLSGADITITSGTSVVLATGASVGDILDVVGYGTFDVASINAGNIDAGTLNIARLGDDSITNAKLAGSIANAKLSNSSITINGSAVALGGSVSVGETKPTVADVSQTIAPATATTITITGTNFVSIPQVDFINASTGAVTRANTVSFTSATSLSVNCTIATGNYYVRIENPDGNAGRSTNNIITASVAPTFSTSAGSLGTFAGNFSGTLATISGSSDSTIAYSETTSNLSGAGVTLNTSTGALTTTDFGGASTTPTTYNFTIRITDAENQTADRSFSFTSSFGATGGGQFN